MAATAVAANTAKKPSVYEQLREVINSTDIAPTIINPDSKFVVVTYWWGRGNLNNNTARPCTDFYEELIGIPFDIITDEGIDPREALDDETFLSEIDAGLTAKAKYYFSELTKQAYDSTNSEHIHQVKEYKSKFKPWVMDFFERDDIQELAIKLFEAGEQVAAIKKRIKEYKNAGRDLTLDEKELNKIKKVAAANMAAIKLNIRPLIGEMRKEFQFQTPIKFEKMIANWEEKCASNGCNYMAVEYPAFAKEGGYQLAINAKPMFIQKALQSCGGRAVLYIDGDMTINQYPHVFDMDDVDFMARGWNIDPRGNQKYKRTILVDPYAFETSGGIMYFANTPEAHQLIDLWIKQSSKSYEAGKADDRIISLIFNIRRLLSVMKIIQLPIEYLWLTMHYDRFHTNARPNIFVEHPECLTSEDTATESGASSSREPIFYKGIQQIPRAEDLHEAVMFPTKKLADQFRPWFEYFKSAKYFGDVAEYDKRLIGAHPFKVTGYDAQLGDKQPIYLKNRKEADEMPSVLEQAISAPSAAAPAPSILADAFVRYSAIYVSHRGISYPGANPAGHILVVVNTIDIPFILRALHERCDVLYIPSFYSVHTNLGVNEVTEVDLFDHPELFTDPRAVRNAVASLSGDARELLTNKLRRYADTVEGMTKVLAGPAGDRLEFIFSDARRRVDSDSFFQCIVDLHQPVFMSHKNEILQTMIAMRKNTADFQQALFKQYQFISRIRIHLAKPVRNPKRFDLPANVTNAVNATAMTGGGELIEHHTEDVLDLMYSYPLNTMNGYPLNTMNGGGVSRRKARRATRARRYKARRVTRRRRA